MYLTYYKRKASTKYSLRNILNQIRNNVSNTKRYTEKHTVLTGKRIPRNAVDPRVMELTYRQLDTLLMDFDNLTEEEKTYHSFRIPKRKGGYRTITAPSQKVKELQSRLVHILKDLMFLPHNIAHAYIENRSIKTNSQEHINSNHFANIDLKNFFPSITLELITETLFNQNLFTTEFQHRLGIQVKLSKAIEEIALYEGKTPQGAVSSPILSNLVMVPFDYHLRELVYEKIGKAVVTRYADDITISSYYKLAPTKEKATKLVEEIVNEALKRAFSKTYFRINKEKTRISSKNGKNRVTGIKINHKNKLSIGYKEKQQLKMDIAGLIIKKLNSEDVFETLEQIFGYWNFLHAIEPEYSLYMLRTLERKFKLDRPVFKFLSAK